MSSPPSHLPVPLPSANKKQRKSPNSNGNDNDNDHDHEADADGDHPMNEKHDESDHENDDEEEEGEDGEAEEEGDQEEDGEAEAEEGEEDDDFSDSHSASASAAAADEDAADSDSVSSVSTIVPTTDSREITLSLSRLNPLLICILCKGYYREAYTINACLDTFCRICLTKYIENYPKSREGVRCPMKDCGTFLVSGDPIRNEAKYDRAIQNVIDKIFPKYEMEEEELKKTIVDEMSKGIYRYEDNEMEDNGDNILSKSKGTEKSHPTPTPSLLPSTSLLPPPSSLPLPRSLYDTSIDWVLFELRPRTSSSSSSSVSLPSLLRPFVKTNPKVTIRLIRKYLISVLKIQQVNTFPSQANNPNNSTSPLPIIYRGQELFIYCVDERLGVDHSIAFVKRTRWHQKSTHMALTYQIGEMQN